MTNTLDRDRPYGEVFGATNDARYIQDGREFNALGVELSKRPGATKARTVGKSKPPVVNAEADALSPEHQVLSQLGVS